MESEKIRPAETGFITKNFTTLSFLKMSEMKLPWLRNLVNFGGALTGIVMTAIGGSLLVNSVLKLYVFKFETEAHFFSSAEECRFDYSGEKKVARKKAEIEVCRVERLQDSKASYRRRKQDNMVDGAAMLMVGIPFWIIFYHKKRFNS